MDDYVYADNNVLITESPADKEKNIEVKQGKLAKLKVKIKMTL